MGLVSIAASAATVRELSHHAIGMAAAPPETAAVLRNVLLCMQCPEEKTKSRPCMKSTARISGYHGGQSLSRFARHDEERLHFEALVVGSEALHVVLLLYIHDFLGRCNRIDRQVVVTAIPENHQASVDLAQKQVEREVAVRHRHDGINRVGVAAADQVAELLVNRVDRFTVVVLRGEFLELLRHQVSDAAEFLVAEGVRGLSREDHLSALEHRSLRNQDDGIAARIFPAVRDQQFGEALDVEFVFRNHATVRGSRWSVRGPVYECVRSRRYKIFAECHLMKTMVCMNWLFAVNS